MFKLSYFLYSITMRLLLTDPGNISRCHSGELFVAPLLIVKGANLIVILIQDARYKRKDGLADLGKALKAGKGAAKA